MSGQQGEVQDGTSEAIVSLSPPVVCCAVQTLTLTYALPAQPPRSASPTRINPAYASWVVAEVGPPGDSTVVIDVPEPYELVTQLSSAPTVDVEAGRRTYTVRIMHERDWWFWAEVRHDALFEERVVPGAPVLLRFWPGDDDWADFAEPVVADGWPRIGDMLGLPPPDEGITVTESFAGTGGLYYHGDRSVEVGDSFDAQTLLHELAHDWIHWAPFRERWINEGLAQLVAENVANQLGGAEPRPALDPANTRSFPLNDWEDQLSQADPDSWMVDEFGYVRSMDVVEQVVDDIGPNGLRAVMKAAADEQIAWVGATEPETFPGQQDWRRFYDLVELVGGAEEVRQVMVRHVLNEEQQELLEQRYRTIERHDALVAELDGWGVPLPVRQQLARWDFESARRVIDRASTLRQRAEAIVVRGRELSVPLGGPLEQVWETEVSTLLIERHFDRVEAMLDGLAELDRPRDDPQRVAVVEALVANELPAAEAALDMAAAADDEPVTTSRQSLLVGVLVVLGFAGLVARTRSRP